jgi:hypothetical protein
VRDGCVELSRLRNGRPRRGESMHGKDSMSCSSRCLLSFPDLVFRDGSPVVKNKGCECVV